MPYRRNRTRHNELARSLVAIHRTLGVRRQHVEHLGLVARLAALQAIPGFRGEKVAREEEPGNEGLRAARSEFSHRARVQDYHPLVPINVPRIAERARDYRVDECVERYRYVPVLSVRKSAGGIVQVFGDYRMV